MSDPAASKAAREEGNTHFRRGRWADAAAAYGRAIAADDGDAVPRANRAMAWLKLERYAEAAADATAALAIDPAHTKARYRRALARRGLGDLDGAAGDLSSVVARGDNAAAREELAEVYAEMLAGSRARAAGRVESAVDKEKADKERAEQVEQSEQVEQYEQVESEQAEREMGSAPAQVHAHAEALLDQSHQPPQPHQPLPASFAALRGKRTRPAYAQAPAVTARSPASEQVPSSTKPAAASAPASAVLSVPSPSVSPALAPPAPPGAIPTPAPSNPASTSPGAGLALLRALRPLSPVQRHAYLWHYPASIVPRILAPTLDPEALGTVLGALDAGVGTGADASNSAEYRAWAHELMVGLRHTPRWAVNAGMLTRAEREAGERVWAAAGGVGTYL
ncbi:hypothetical protein CspeluHIS016_0307950 [Cutaneotrichosporon spelunceum]|uniref:RNA-polymerase II-associated protein 3-like C-terminal domain-containing protein n=1 Tax=Cutaneotrichosporon spelunceum TaxID=1672016 RepID=A0AAD3TU48_9TREE|nr:hypothetical protein CspeluHIS016_0307950 [Cutaneotrichosporon spelunceum]